MEAKEYQNIRGTSLMEDPLAPYPLYSETSKHFNLLSHFLVPFFSGFVE